MAIGVEVKSKRLEKLTGSGTMNDWVGKRCKDRVEAVEERERLCREHRAQFLDPIVPVLHEDGCPVQPGIELDGCTCRPVEGRRYGDIQR